MSSSPDPALEIRSLKFRYSRKSPWVVDIPSLTLSTGEQMLVTGPSGRGKSTLLHLVSGLMEPKEGRVLVDGQAVHELRGAARDHFRGRKIGVIFQNFNLLHGFSAMENVMAALLFSGIPAGEHRKRAKTLLGHLGIQHPRRQSDRMSIGQQQRVAVARAMVCDPVLVLADEPTASLDPENAKIAMDLIQQSCRERDAALLCVSHDPALDERFERRESLDGERLGVGDSVLAGGLADGDQGSGPAPDDQEQSPIPAPPNPNANPEPPTPNPSV